MLRAPAAAVRFRPARELLDALGATAASPGQAVLWQEAGESIAAVPVRTGLSDGAWTELIDAPLEGGARVITRAVLATTPAAATPARSSSPLMGSQPVRR